MSALAAFGALLALLCSLLNGTICVVLPYGVPVTGWIDGERFFRQYGRERLAVSWLTFLCILKKSWIGGRGLGLPYDRHFRLALPSNTLVVVLRGRLLSNYDAQRVVDVVDSLQLYDDDRPSYCPALPASRNDRWQP